MAETKFLGLDSYTEEREALRPASDARLAILLALVFLAQPWLDVLSYVLNVGGLPVVVSTGLRGLVFLFVFVLGWLGGVGSKRSYFGLAILVGGFWLLHMGIVWTGGDRAWMPDLVNYLKLAQLPLFTYAFLRLQRRVGLRLQDLFFRACLVNLYVILILDLLAWLTGTGLPTYRDLGRGFLGWYYIANAQSNLLAILFPAALLAVTRMRLKSLPRLLLFLFTTLAGGFRLFCFGTRVTFVALVGSCVIVAALLLLEQPRRNLAYALCLVLALALSLGFYRLSPMAQIRSWDSHVAETNFEDIQAKLNKIKKPGGQTGWTHEQYELFYNYYVPQLVRTFGLDAVLDEYGHSQDHLLLRNVREQKIHFARMRLKQAPKLERITGLGFGAMHIPGEEGSYDLESDLPAFFYYNGWLGTALVLLWLLILGWRLLILLRRRGLLNCIRDPLLMTVGYLSCLLALAAATGGSVLRRPSVSVYFAWLLASLWAFADSFKRRRGSHQKPV